MTDRAFRSLAKLQTSAATARTLDLHSLHERLSGGLEWAERPLFDNRKLNRAIILKHRLRRNEVDQLGRRRGVATKVVLPLDPANLRTGGQYFFVGEKGYDGLLRNVLGGATGASARDLQLLEILDGLPGFDPFLIRESLRGQGLEAASCYFQVTEPDMRRMHAFVQAELTPLVQSSFSGQVAIQNSATILADKLLSSGVDEKLEPLRVTLKLEPAEFVEGVFCWRSFLYYKWNLAKVAGEAAGVIDEIERATPRGVLDRETRAYLDRARRAIAVAMVACLKRVREPLHAYEAAYQQLAEGGLPGPFRTFLLEAPTRFAGLGAPLGVVSDITSFWRYRFPEAGPPNVSGEDLRDLLLDFEASLEIEAQDPMRRLVVAPQRLAGCLATPQLGFQGAPARLAAVQTSHLL